MKYAIPIRSHRVHPPHPRSRVPGHMRAIHPSSPYPFTLYPRDLGLTGSTRVLDRRQSFHLSLQPMAGPLNPNQNPKFGRVRRKHGRLRSSRCIERAPGSTPATRPMAQSARIRYSPMTFQAQSAGGNIEDLKITGGMGISESRDSG
jgi:hypothetical protein